MCAGDMGIGSKAPTADLSYGRSRGRGDSGKGTLSLSVFRFDPVIDARPRYDCFEIETFPGMTLLQALFEVLDRHDGSLSFRFSCREAICGSCTMFVNGSYSLACQTQLQDLRSRHITVNPMPHLPIIKDLVVDMGPFFEKYALVRPYLMNDGEPPERERLQTPRERKLIDEMISCILCGACYSSCPSVWLGHRYLGPAPLMWAYRFLADSRDTADRRRLALVAHEDGTWRCHTIFNCVEACPKEINLTWSIQQLKMRGVKGR